MKRLFISAILIVFFISLTALPARAADDEIRGARYAPHLILPLFGYQTIDNEMINLTYDFYFKILIENIDTLETSYDSSATTEHSVKAPMLGFVYRFRPNHYLNVDASFAMLHDATSFKYNVYLPIFEYSTETLEMTIKRSNTLYGALDIGYNIPLPMKWLGVSVNGGAGYAYRKVESEDYHEEGTNGNIFTKADVINTNQQTNGILLYRGGLEFSLWTKNHLIVMGSVFYTQFQPSNSDNDAFGGFGWKICLFPIWFEL